MTATRLTVLNADRTFYGTYFSVLQSAENKITYLLTELKKTYAVSGRRFPAEQFKTRVKSAKSTRDKLARLGLPQTAQAAQAHLFDLVGARIICQFIDDIYEFKAVLEKSEGFEIIQVEDYAQSPKPNGYRSLHLVAHVPIETSGGTFQQSIEFQIRTIAMDFWASLEHELKYKKNIRDADLMHAELKRCAEEVASLDLTMSTIREWLEQ